MQTKIPIAVAKKIIKNTNPNNRISKNASIELATILEEIGTIIAQNAKTLTKHAGRKTIKASNIKLAYNNL